MNKNLVMFLLCCVVWSTYAQTSDSLSAVIPEYQKDGSDSNSKDYGQLTITTVPDSVKFTIDIINVTGITPYYNNRVETGTYQLRLEKATYEPVFEEITIVKDSINEVSFNLVHTRSFLDSAKRAQKRVLVRKLIIRQSIFGLCALGAGAAGLYFNSEADDKYNKAGAAKIAYLSARDGADFTGLYNKYKNYHDEVDGNIKKRNILYCVSGAFTLTFAISFMF